MKQKLMMIGMGDLAWWTLEILVRSPGFSEHVKVLACDNNEEIGLRRVNSALISSSQTHLPPDLQFQYLDCFNLGEMAEAISAFQPDLIFDGTSLQSWWVITKLSPEMYRQIDRARYGPWIPMHCTLTYNIMRAVKMAGLSTKVINCGFPDVTNCALGKLDLAPHVGIGNLDNIVPPIRFLVAERENVPVNSVQAYLFTSHFLSYYLGRFNDTAGCPFILKLFIDGIDISGKYDTETLLQESSIKYRRQGGTAGHSVVGASCAKNVLHVLRDSRSLTHAPGPCGLPGGYPVRIGSSEVELALPPGISFEQALEVNRGANRFDGVEEIRDDGSIVITDESYTIMKELLGYDCKEMRIEDAAEWAKELRLKFEHWAGIGSRG
jgi:hypothetical protein